VVGIAVVDAVARPVDAFPAPGGLRFFDSLTLAPGGNAVSCSIALARLGIAAEVVARVGVDPLGDFILAELERNAVCARLVTRDPTRTTSFSFVSVTGGGERSFLHTTGANAALRAEDAPAVSLAGKRFVFITGAMLMDSLDGAPTARLLRDARAAGAATLLDTVYVEAAPVEEWRRRILPALPALDYFIPSEAEARAISGDDNPARMARFFRDHGARHVVIKLGERGVLSVPADAGETLVPALRVASVVDATGAGDCWAAGFIAGLRSGESMQHAARLGNAVAAAAIQGAGATTALRNMNQVAELMHGRN
jgi:sugar/nucleoside kinase (ribokinase family)